MIVLNAMEKQANKIETYPYRGTPLPVKDTSIRWLSQAGPDGAPEYGLRFFTIGPGGEIPIHKHLYYQTVYMLSGHLLAVSYNAETDEKVAECVMGPTDFVFIPTMEPHSFLNQSEAEEATFLCCIANVYEGDAI